MPIIKFMDDFFVVFSYFIIESIWLILNFNMTHFLAQKLSGSI